MPSSTQQGPRLAFIYLTIVVGGLAIALDFASVDLALPALERQFNLTLEGVQWVINGYILAFSVLMVVGGKLADAYGRRTVFILGYIVFAVASLIGGAAWSGGVLIAARVTQGVGAAMLWPAMIGLGCGAVEKDRQPMVMGLLMATCSVGNAAGPVVGGALTQWFSWRWVLWINVPMALLTLAVVLATVPRDRVDRTVPVRNDYAGMVALTGGLIFLMLVAYQGLAWGWFDPRVIAFCVAALVLLAAFPIIESHVRAPLIPPELIRNPEIASLCFAVLAICQVFFVVLLYYTQFGLKFLGDDAIDAGARVAQFMISYGLTSYFSGALIGKIGARALLLFGLGISTIACVLLGIFGPGSNPLVFNATLILLGLGVGAVIPTVTTRAIDSVGTENAGLVSGVTFMAQLAGAALMLAINTAIFAAIASADFKSAVASAKLALTSAQQEAAYSILNRAGTLHAIPEARIDDVPEIAGIITHSYEAGLSVVMYIGAALLIIAFILVATFVPKKRASSGTTG